MLRALHSMSEATYFKGDHDEALRLIMEHLVQILHFTCVPACVRTCVCACVCACMRARVSACVRACVRVCVHACVRACVRAGGGIVRESFEISDAFTHIYTRTRHKYRISQYNEAQEYVKVVERLGKQTYTNLTCPAVKSAVSLGFSFSLPHPRLLSLAHASKCARTL